MSKAKVLTIFLLTFILNSCSSDLPNQKTEYRTGIGKVTVRNFTTKSEGFSFYQSHSKHSYKVFAENPQYENIWGYGASNLSLERAIKVSLSGKACMSKGCIITNVNGEKTSEAQQIKYVNMHYSTYMAKQLLAQITTGQSYSQKKPNRRNDDLNESFRGFKNTDLIPVSSGTGFFVNKIGNIVTNYHVIQECKKIELIVDGSNYSVDLISSDKTNDLALLKSKSIKPKNSLGISKDGPNLLQNIYVAGYPLGKKVSNSIKFSAGKVSSLAGYNDNYSNFQIDAALNSGNSGGPIVDDKGNVVGVAVAHFGKSKGIESFNFGIKASVLENFLKSNDVILTYPNNSNLSTEKLAREVSDSTLFIECFMTVAQLKSYLKEKNKQSQKAIYSGYLN